MAKDDTQTLLELREKMEMNMAYLGMVQAQQRRTALNLRRAQLTVEELEALPADATMFKSVGKAYFLAPKPELVSELRGDMKAGEDQASELARQHERASKAVRAIEAEASEVARSNPAAGAAFRRLMGGGP